MRRIAIWALLAVLGCFALAAAPLANAQTPTIVTNITFPEGEFLGTFTASAPLCPSGTFVDQVVGGGGAFDNAHVLVFAVTVRKLFTCADGTGTFTIQFHTQLTPATAAGCHESGPFAVVDGTGAYAKLRGHGDFCLLPALSEGVFRETFTGAFRLG
jgi:hypothetical protein